MKNVLKTVFCLALVAGVGFIIGAVGSDEVWNVLFGNADLDLAMALGAAAGIAGPGGSLEGGATHQGVDEYEDIHDLDLDKMIVKVRPSDVPIDTLIRELESVRSTDSIKTGGYEIGTRDVDDTITQACDGSSDVMSISVSKKAMWVADDTLIVPGVKGGDGKPLQLYVLSKDNQAGTLNVIASNPAAGGNLPAIASGEALLRLGNAKSETDAQTTAFQQIPVTRYNNCQIHMGQVEESVIESLHKKKVALDMGTYKEQSIWEMKRGMEFTNLFGVQSVMTNPDSNKLVYTSDGVWNMMTETSEFDPAKAFDNAFYVALTKEIFDNNNGSDRRLLLAGADFLERMAYVDAYSKQVDPKNVEVIHGVRFNRVVTNFGELLVKQHTLFRGAFSDCAMVLDMSYLRKEVYEPLHTVELDLDKTGQKRVKAYRMIENYCLFLENLPTHRRIRPQTV